MLLQSTLDRRELRLLGMVTALEDQAIVPDVRALSLENRPGPLVERASIPRGRIAA
jgi:hypothetical protein